MKVIYPGIIKRIKRMLTGNYVEDGNTASQNIPAGKYVMWKNGLYKAKSAITTGDTLSSSNLEAVADGGINALNSKSIYSTDEQVIGMWITGDTLYRRVIPNLSITNGYMYDITTANIKEMINVGGFAFNSSSDELFSLNSTDTGGTKVIAVYKKLAKRIDFWMSNGTWNVTLILTYTKN